MINCDYCGAGMDANHLENDEVWESFRDMYRMRGNEGLEDMVKTEMMNRFGLKVLSDEQYFVYDQIYKGALGVGASEMNAKNQAILGVEDYKKCRDSTGKKIVKLDTGKMIQKRIKLAKSHK